MAPSRLNLKQQWKGQLARWARRLNLADYLLPISQTSLFSGKRFASSHSTTLAYVLSDMVSLIQIQPPKIISRQPFQFQSLSENLKTQTQQHFASSRLLLQSPAYQEMISCSRLLFDLEKFAFKTWPSCNVKCIYNFTNHQNESTAGSGYVLFSDYGFYFWI